MKSIGKYQVVEELGGNATGKTYRVRDSFRNREFAAKVLHTVPGLTAEAKEQFCGHLAACAELTHRHIAKVYDLGEIEEGIFVATEWRSGTDLRRFMQDNQGLPLGQKLAITAQVAEGLAFANSRGIAHGNLKPSNIFIDGARDVSILDFGIAKWLAALLEAGSRPDGLVANYLSPEQILGQPFDARSDIFALGLMLYEFASGKYPFAGEAGLIPREIVHTEPEPLRKLDAQVPEELEQLVMRALKKDPAQRLQTAEEFASGLYLAAQQLRRAVPVATPVEAPALVKSASEPNLNQLAAALTPGSFTPRPAPPSEEFVLPPVATSVSDGNVFEASRVHAPAAPPPRQRPQDAEPAAQPWTARSYANNAPPVSIPEPPQQPPAASLPAPVFEPPKSFLKPTAPVGPPSPRGAAPQVVKAPGKMTRRVLIAAIGLILAVGIVGSLISRQNLRASQARSHAASAVTEPVAPVVKPPAPPPAPVQQVKTPKPGESGPDDLGNPEFSARQTLNGPVRSRWESGRYAEALALVNQVLANDPNSDEALAWRKKIRAAQAAEAALK